LGLSPLLGVDPRVGPRRVDERQDRPAELRRELHDAQRLAVALRLCHPEVARDLLLRVPSLLVADDRDRTVLVEREAADERGIVAVAAVAVDFSPLCEQGLDVVEGVRTVRVARDERLLPRRQAREHGLALLLELLAEALRLFLLRGIAGVLG